MVWELKENYFDPLQNLNTFLKKMHYRTNYLTFNLSTFSLTDLLQNKMWPKIESKLFEDFFKTFRLGLRIFLFPKENEEKLQILLIMAFSQMCKHFLEFRNI